MLISLTTHHNVEAPLEGLVGSLRPRVFMPLTSLSLEVATTSPEFSLPGF